MTEATLSAYTEGERRWMQSTLTIDGIKRADDGLYECQAENEGGRFYKSGHITVEFAPTFEDQLYDKEWSWDQRPIELTCIATAIPNATVTWWYKGQELGRTNLDKNYVIKGHGSTHGKVGKSTSLTITPLSQKYFGHYKCKAENPLGIAFHEIELVEAREPSEIQQAVLDKQTATTLQFRLVKYVTLLNQNEVISYICLGLCHRLMLGVFQWTPLLWSTKKRGGMTGHRPRGGSGLQVRTQPIL